MGNKHIVLAGASSAMAMATARLLKQAGHRVTGISTKQPGSGYDAWLTVDNYNFGSFPAIEGVIDGLVYFPGTINLKPFNRLSADDFLNDYRINSLGAAAFTQAYLTNIKESAHASIVYVSTVAAGTGMPFHASIAMAKGALEALTRSLAAELAPATRVNAVAPSLVQSPLGNKFINTPEKTEAAQKRNPMKKVGTPEEVAGVIALLLGDQAAWITGQVLAVDGGMGSLKLL